VPTKLEALADPKWKGRLGVASTTGSPFDRLVLVLVLVQREEQTAELLRSVLKNQPLRKQGSSALAESIVNGEAGLACVSPSYAMSGKKRGAPVDWRPMEYIPVIALFTVVPENATNPNMARLFAAWLATEGTAIMDQYQFLGRVDDPSTTLGRIITQQMPNAPIYTERSEADFEKTNAAATRFVKLFQEQ
jgi:ABC-type Fe3+ transport system substrate-binding protein